MVLCAGLISWRWVSTHRGANGKLCRPIRWRARGRTKFSLHGIPASVIYKKSGREAATKSAIASSYSWVSCKAVSHICELVSMPAEGGMAPD